MTTESVSSQPPAASAQPSLLRALGPWVAITVVVGNVIGSGVFLKPGTIARDGGDVTLILFAWLAGGVLCLFGALCFAELATMMPRAGGMFVYLRQTYGPAPAFLFGWSELFFTRPGSIGALSVAFVASLAEVLGFVPSSLMQVLLATSVILLMAWINYLGVVWGGAVQATTTVVKVAGVLLIAATPWLMYMASGSGINPANYGTHISTEVIEAETGSKDGDGRSYSGSAGVYDRGLAARFGIILLAIMWAYNGWHAITPVAEEVRDPNRNIPRALIGGIGILIVLYLGANIAYHGVLSMDQMAAAGEQSTHRMAEQLLGGTGRSIVAAIIMCSTFGAINANLLLAPRIAFAMGRDGLFFSQLGRVHANYRSPATAILVQAAMAVALVAFSGVLTAQVSRVTKAQIHQAVAGESPEVRRAISEAIAPYQRGLLQRAMTAVENRPQEVQDRIAKAIAEESTVIPNGFLHSLVQLLADKSIFELLTNLVIFGASIFYMLCVLAVFILRRRNPDWPRPYRTWGYPWVPAVFLLVYCWFMVQIYREAPFEANWGLVLIALGLPVHFAWQWYVRKDGQAAD